jgi:hypothetical protein
LGRRIKYVVMGGMITALAVLGMEMMSRGNAWTPQYIQRHTPTVEMQAPETLAELPLLKETPPASFALWFPGTELRFRWRWLKQYPALSGVRFEKHFFDDRIIARLEPRVPLVHWADRGVDKDGVVFTLASQRWLPLPKADFPPSESLPALGRWLAEVSRIPDFWSQVVAISEDPRGEMWLDLGTGTHVAWGLPDAHIAREKARCLAMVLDDAHHRLSGAATADLRFFEEGRVIVRPKTVT